MYIYIYISLIILKLLMTNIIIYIYIYIYLMLLAPSSWWRDGDGGLRTTRPPQSCIPRGYHICFIHVLIISLLLIIILVLLTIYIYIYIYIYILIISFYTCMISLSYTLQTTRPPQSCIPQRDKPLRPISLLRLSLLRFVDSICPGNSLWTW